MSAYMKSMAVISNIDVLSLVHLGLILSYDYTVTVQHGFSSDRKNQKTIICHLILVVRQRQRWSPCT